MITNRIRFGIRIPIFRNLGVIVFYTSAAATVQFSAAVDVIRTVLFNAGIDANSIVFEATPVMNPPAPRK